MFTATSIVSPSVVTILTCLVYASAQSCSWEDVDQSSVQDQDGDLVSFLQAGSSPHLSIGVKEGSQSTGSRSKQSSLVAPATKAATTKPDQAVITVLSNLAHQTERFAARLFGPGNEWAMPVVIVVLTLLAVAFVSFVILEERRVVARHRGEQETSSSSAAPLVQPRMAVPTARRVTEDPVIQPPQSRRSRMDPRWSEQSLPVSMPASSGLPYQAAPASLMLSRPDNGIPPLCPTLVLPTLESKFAVRVEDMMKAELGSELSVCGVDSKPVLKLKVNTSQFGTRLDVHVDQSGRTGDRIPVDARPRCSIIAPSDDRKPFEIRGAGDKHYGTFQHVEGKSTLFEIEVENRPVMIIEGSTKSMRLDVITPSPQDYPVAWAAENTTDYNSGEPHFEIRVLPGFDAMLVIAVAMTIMIFIENEWSTHAVNLETSGS